MVKGIRHKDVGGELTYDEFHAEDAHEIASGTSFPASPSEGDLFYRTDEHNWYQYDGTEWIGLLFASGSHPSGTLRLSDDGEETTTSLVYVKLQEVTIVDENVVGARVKFDLRSDADYYGSWAKIYKNDVAIGVERYKDRAGWDTFTEDIICEIGDKIQLYAKTQNASKPAHTRNFRIYYDFAVGRDPTRLRGLYAGLRTEHGLTPVSDGETKTVTFDTAFAEAPIVVFGFTLTQYTWSTIHIVNGSITTTQFQLYAASAKWNVYWLAIGIE